ncbi:MAG TPA: polymer-forming cytoskeletal protein [Thermosulfurimonas dismutans]|uniref:Polymer-forming cytoskeletal protein n=1 Tax=Thermosulfurimonas dismutans TaxID=999894 RepID=A0A7C3GG30_9BACT|nr:polymer-forming cytoskeletal protein [Thermosulfurimonas dismutans]
MRWKKTPPAEEMNAYIGPGLKLEGHLVFSGQAKFEGEFEGELKGDRLIIGESGTIRGGVEASEIICFGRIEGRITARVLHLKKTARVQGEIYTQKLAVEEGAFLEGRVKAGGEQIPPSEGAPEAPAKPEPATPRRRVL